MKKRQELHTKDYKFHKIHFETCVKMLDFPEEVEDVGLADGNRDRLLDHQRKRDEQNRHRWGQGSRRRPLREHQVRYPGWTFFRENFSLLSQIFSLMIKYSLKLIIGYVSSFFKTKVVYFQWFSYDLFFIMKKEPRAYFEMMFFSLKYTNF